MKIKDIVNKDLVNLQNCDQEPIHIPGSIQPHGFLVGIDKENFQINFCSENIHEFLGILPQQALGKNITDLLGQECLVNLKTCLQDAPGQSRIFKASVAGKAFEFVAHLSPDNTLILEGELPITETSLEAYDMIAISKQFMSYMEEAHTLVQLCTLVAQGIAKTTGYDRVMIYRFDKDYNGEVIAEHTRPDLESFLGLHYPHTDIPVQARELYVKNLLRLIADIQYRPVPLYTEDNGKNKTLDLSYSTLRSVSPIHVQYLQNMGVGATLTISLIHKKKLWGLISCHHYAPKQLSHETRLAAKLQGHFITSQIDVRQSNEEYENSRKTNQAVEELISRTFELSRNSLAEIVEDPNLQTLCNANGVAILIDNTIYKNGSTPTEEGIRKLANALADKTNFTAYQTHALSEKLMELGVTVAEIPGVNYFPLDKKSGNAILWFRKETISQVNWAGDPNKAIEKDTNGLSPRKSFELWKETVKNKSLPWLNTEIHAASNFVNVLQKHLSSVYLAEEEEKQRALALKLSEMNAELENISWISTHDLQEPLRKIQMLTSFVVEEEHSLATESLQKIDRINKAAARMQTLIKDILRYSRLNYSSEALERTDLNVLIEDVRNDVEETLAAKNATITVEKLPEVEAVSFLIKQVFSNLIYNSLKFTVPGRNPEIKITACQSDLPGRSQKFHCIQITDNGIGFEESFNESVFKIFTRLHSANDYPGSGIGLALCRKIMTNHKGFIKAEGVPGKGATFSLYFPVV